WNADRIAAARDAVLGEVMETLELSADGKAQPLIEDFASMRYAGQSYSIEIPYTVPADPKRIEADFLKVHKALYGFVSDEPWEIESIRTRVTASAHIANPGNGKAGEKSGAKPDITSCWFAPGKPMATAQHRRGELMAGNEIRGPAIVRDDWSTVVV